MGPHTGCMDELCVNVFFFSSLRGVLLVSDYFFRSVNVNLTCMGAHTGCMGAHTGCMHEVCVTVFFFPLYGGFLLGRDYFFRTVNVKLNCMGAHTACMGAHTVCTGAHTGFMHELCVTVFFSQFKGRLACT